MTHYERSHNGVGENSKLEKKINIGNVPQDYEKVEYLRTQAIEP